MSGPVTTSDTPATPEHEPPEECGLEVIDGRSAEVAGFGVRRVLPRRLRRTVGAWCFADHIGPGQVGANAGLDVGPHPHIGLQTVTWLLEGSLMHRDSLGSEQRIRPGQLNLMTAGRGVSHSEESTGFHSGPLHGVQLWVAQPASTRDGDPAFEHHPELPIVELPGATATVIVGELLDGASPARRDTDHLGAELTVRDGAATVPLGRDREHGLVALDGAVRVGDAVLTPGHLGYLGIGRDEVRIEADRDARVLVLGGVPFDEPLLMWWNYVARTRGEVTEAHRDWSSGSPRFGSVASPLERIDVPGPPWS